MDLIHRKEKYKEYLKKIEKAKSGDGDFKFIEALEARSEVILNELRDQNDKREMNLAIAFITIPFTLLAAISYFKVGASFALIPFGLLLIYLVVYRLRMQAAARAVKKYRIDNRDKVADKDINWLKKKIEYITYGIEVKLARLRLTKIFYMIFFPLLLVLLGEFLFGEIYFGNRFLSLFVAFLIGGLFWHYFFNEQIDEMEEIQSDLTQKMRLLK